MNLRVDVGRVLQGDLVASGPKAKKGQGTRSEGIDCV